MAKARFLAAIAWMGHTKAGREGDEIVTKTLSDVVVARDEEHAITILRDRFNLERGMLTAAVAAKVKEP